MNSRLTSFFRDFYAVMILLVVAGFIMGFGLWELLSVTTNNGALIMALLAAIAVAMAICLYGMWFEYRAAHFNPQQKESSK